MCLRILKRVLLFAFVLVVLIEDSICTTCTASAFSFHLYSLQIFLASKSVSKNVTPICEIALLANAGLI